MDEKVRPVNVLTKHKGGITPLVKQRGFVDYKAVKGTTEMVIYRQILMHMWLPEHVT